MNLNLPRVFSSGYQIILWDCVFWIWLYFTLCNIWLYLMMSLSKTIIFCSYENIIFDIFECFFCCCIKFKCFLLINIYSHCILFSMILWVILRQRQRIKNDINKQYDVKIAIWNVDNALYQQLKLELLLNAIVREIKTQNVVMSTNKIDSRRTSLTYPFSDTYHLCFAVNRHRHVFFLARFWYNVTFLFLENVRIYIFMLAYL